MITPYLEWDYSSLRKMFPSIVNLRYSERDIREAVLNPAIIHMVDGMCGRPWEKGNINKLNKRWHDFLKTTRFSDGWRDFNIGETFPHKMMRGIYRVVPRAISSLLYIWNQRRKM